MPKPVYHLFGDDWDRKFLLLASNIAQWSKDRGTKVGCVIVGPHRELRSTGYNGFARGIDDDVEERHERPGKYAFTEHSERNAIYNAARVGVSLQDCVLYFWSPTKGFPPCSDCARGIIQSGISRVVGKTGDFDASVWRPDWKATQQIAYDMLLEAGVLLNEVAL